MDCLIKAVAVAAIACIGNVRAETQDVTSPLAISNFSGTIWLTTDYVYRGLSNTDEGPAIQGSLDWNYSDFYLGVWSSNTRYSDAGIEIDYYGGYTWEWNDLSFDLSGLYYQYPGENRNISEGSDPGGGQEADYWEASIGSSRAFEGMLLSKAGITYFYSPDYFGEDGDAHAVEGNLALSLPCEFGFGVFAGYQVVIGDKSSSGYDYIWWQIGISREIFSINLDLSYHGVDDEGEACGGDLCDERVVFTISRVF